MTQPIDPLRVLAMTLLGQNTPESAAMPWPDTLRFTDVEDQTRVMHSAQVAADLARAGFCLVPAGTMQYMTARLARFEALHGMQVPVQTTVAKHVHTTECYRSGSPCGMGFAGFAEREAARGHGRGT